MGRHSSTDICLRVLVGRRSVQLNMDSELDYDEETGRNPLRDRMKQLESENAELKARAEEASAAARELASVKAGVDPTLPIAKYFLKVYAGATIAEASREAATRPQLPRDTRQAQVPREPGA